VFIFNRKGSPIKNEHNVLQSLEAITIGYIRTRVGLSPICFQCYLCFFPAILLNSTYFAHWLCLFFSLYAQWFTKFVPTLCFLEVLRALLVQNRNYTSCTTRATATHATVADATTTTTGTSSAALTVVSNVIELCIQSFCRVSERLKFQKTLTRRKKKKILCGH